MIFSDINMLLYAYNEAAPEHEQSRLWLESTMASGIPFCLSWHTLMGFLRISTSLNAFPKPYSSDDALEIASDLIGASSSLILLPGPRHFQIFQKLVKESRITGAKLMDAHIAALAIEHGATVATSDRDFRLFDGLKFVNPLAN